MEPISDALLAPMPLADVAGLSSVPDPRPSTRKDVCPERDGAFTSPAPACDNLDEKGAPVPPRAPRLEEMATLLKQVPCFTEAEPLSTNMVNFFPLTKWVLVDLDDNPSIIIIVRLPYNTSKSIVSRVQPM